jgi:hypothetical protein
VGSIIWFMGKILLTSERFEGSLNADINEMAFPRFASFHVLLSVNPNYPESKMQNSFMVFSVSIREFAGAPKKRT